MLLRAEPRRLFSWRVLHSCSLPPFFLSVLLFLLSLAGWASGFEQLSLLRSDLALQQSRCATRGQEERDVGAHSRAREASPDRVPASLPQTVRQPPQCSSRSRSLHSHWATRSAGRRTTRAPSPIRARLGGSLELPKEATALPVGQFEPAHLDPQSSATRVRRANPVSKDFCGPD